MEPEAWRREAATQLLPVALRAARGKCRDWRRPHLADECESLALVALWEAVLGFDPARGCTVERHVAARVRMAVRDFLRAQSAGDALPEDAPAPERDEDRADAEERAGRLLALADARDRPVLALVYREGWTQEEAGARLGLSRTAARDAAQRGLATIRRRRRVEAPEQPGVLGEAQAGRLSAAIARQGCTRCTLEARSGFGHTHIADVLGRRKELTTETLARLASALCVQSDWILHGGRRDAG